MFQTDELISVGDAASYLCVSGQPVTRQTIYNWIKRGVEIDGHRLYLKSEVHDRHVYTTIDWIETFIVSTQRHDNRRGRPRLADRL